MTVPIRGEVGNVLPCRQVDPELFFAEVPADVEEAKALCRDCPIRRPAWPARWSGASPGVSGVVSCSSAVSWWRASGRGAVRGSTRWPIRSTRQPARTRGGGMIAGELTVRTIAGA